MHTKDYFIHLTKEELPATLACIRAVPSENDSYTPNAKARSARRLVAHIIGHPADLIEAIETGAIQHRNEMEFSDYESAATLYEADTNRLVELVKTVDENTWDEKMIDFYVGGRKLYARTLRDISYRHHSDVLHHRGQLSTYYRQMGVPNPVIYGATAETVEARRAAAEAKN